MDASSRNLVILLVIVCVGGALVSYLFLSLFAEMNGGDPYNQDHDYTLEGTWESDGVRYDVTGSAESVTMVESANDHIYSFVFHARYGNVEKTIKSTLMCEKDGTPIDLFEFVKDVGDGFSEWKFTKDGMTFVYEVGDHCLVRSVHVNGDSADLTATIVKG